MFGKRKSKDENDKGTQSAPDPLSGLGKQPTARSGRSDDQPSPAPLAATSHPASPTPPPSRVGLITAPAAEPVARAKPSAAPLDDGPADGGKSVALEPAAEPAAEPTAKPADAPADQTRPDEQVKAVDAG